MKKVRVWDSKLLADTFVTTAQMQVQIEQMMAQMPNISLSDVPHSLVPTKNLYEIVACYGLMYNLLVDKELVDTGNKKLDRTKIH